MIYTNKENPRLQSESSVNQNEVILIEIFPTFGYMLTLLNIT